MPARAPIGINAPTEVAGGTPLKRDGSGLAPRDPNPASAEMGPYIAADVFLVARAGAGAVVGACNDEGRALDQRAAG